MGPAPLDDVPPLPEREQDKPIRVYGCGTCGERGHNARSCGKPRRVRRGAGKSPRLSRGPR